MSKNYMFFTYIMNRRIIYIVSGLIISIFFALLLFGSKNKSEAFSEVVKLSLRDVGNQLLLANKDTKSLVLPVVALEPNKFKLSFQEPLAIAPDSLTSIIKNSFQLTNLPENYRVAVVQCSDKEIAYSYEMKNLLGNDIIPCRGRNLVKNCYSITVHFTEIKTSFSYIQLLYSVLLIGGLLLVVFGIIKKNSVVEIVQGNNDEFTSIGSFQFYPEQNKLVKQAEEINLSKKECEILALFIEKPNQIIKREDITKKVWEDNGVIVGRSLDTYISKLRKKLQADSSIKISNIHGVGYKLEV